MKKLILDKSVELLNSLKQYVGKVTLTDTNVVANGIMQSIANAIGVRAYLLLF